MTDDGKTREQLLEELEALRRRNASLVASEAQLESEASKRGRTEEALPEPESLFRRMFDKHSSVMLLIEPGSGRIVDANTAAVLYYGYPKASLTKMAIQDINQLDPEEVARLRREAATGTHTHFAFPHKLMSGEVRDVEVHSTQIEFMGKDLLFSVIHDVTERTQAVEALRQSEERFRSIVQNTAAGYFFIDKDGLIRDVNDAWLSLYGYADRCEVVGQHFATIQRAQDADLAREFVAGIMAGNTDFTGGEFSRKLRGGAEGYHTFSARPVFEGHEVAGIEGFIIDVTERKRAEGALLTMAEMLDTAPSAITVHDFDGRFLYANQKTFELHGYDEAEFMALTLSELDLPDSAALIAERMRLIAERGEALFEVSHLRKDGTTFPLEVFVKRVVWQDIPAILSIGTDISERKRADEERRSLEAQIQRAQKMESLGILAGGIAHDFNNILTGLLVNAELALEDLPPHSPTRPMLLDVVKAGRRAADLTGEMLAYSGRGAFEVVDIDINVLMQDMASLLASSTSKKAELSYELCAELPAVRADATQLRQVVLSLVTNASDAVGEQEGRIALRTYTTDCDAAFLAAVPPSAELAEGRYVTIEVKDSGHGMDDETQAKVFDPFFTTKFTGRGLGLSASQGIVRGHQGAILVESALGKGTTFKVLLPALDHAAVPVGGRPKEETGSRGAETILVVDDEEMVRRVAVRVLKRLGLSVLTASDGVEAVDLFRERHSEIACVLLDLKMPRMGGEEAFEELRKIKDDVPVILLSGYSERQATAQFAGKGLAGFIQKPYEAVVLRTKVREVLGNGK